MLGSVVAVLAAAWQFVIRFLVGLQRARVVSGSGQSLLHLFGRGLLVVVNQRELAVLLVPAGAGNAFHTLGSFFNALLAHAAVAFHFKRCLYGFGLGGAHHEHGGQK